MRLLLEALDNPQHRLRIVHIAGSKGKATTAAHVANILTAAGYRTGRFISPHLNSWRERIAIDNALISQAAFTEHGVAVLSAIERLESRAPQLGRVNAFEMLLAMALDFFVSQSCTCAAIEVGLGGRYDPTNVLDTSVSIVTLLEFEHADILGPTMADIAWNKAGIFKPGVPAVVLDSGEVAQTTLQRVAQEVGAPLHVEQRDWTWTKNESGVSVQIGRRTIHEIEPVLPGLHQRRNAALAAMASQMLSGLEATPSAEAVRLGVKQTTLPGHFEIAERDGFRFVLDVAHTPSSIEALVDGLRAAGIRDYRVIAGFLGDKEIAQMVDLLATAVSELQVVPVRHVRSASFEQLQGAADAAPAKTAVHSQLEDVLFPADSQLHTPEWTVVTGSTALVAEARERLGLADRS